MGVPRGCSDKPLAERPGKRPRSGRYALSRGRLPVLTFSVARTLTFSVAIDRSLRRARRRAEAGRSIPAHGEASEIGTVDRIESGLSPPTRGSPLRSAGHSALPGSIPAHAGKPMPCTSSASSMWVYPRPRGEATPRKLRSLCPSGLSPPTWGSRLSASPLPALRTVYPRPRGEALEFKSANPDEKGLSPPTRGSPFRERPYGRFQRSIPAHAGKPARFVTSRHRYWVYPRPRGEALNAAFVRWLMGGLSPPTRGSLPNPMSRLFAMGSIPAHAGKPLCGLTARHPLRVYPRPRGEAFFLGPRRSVQDGLSPPTRGSPVSPHQGLLQDGSIPAHAGKPAVAGPRIAVATVYPRPRGEAADVPRNVRQCRGLSPPTRGSQPPTGSKAPTPRSIPAHAGKPDRPHPARSVPGVYPRPRGHGRRVARPAPPPLPHRQHPRQQLPDAAPRRTLKVDPPLGVPSNSRYGLRRGGVMTARRLPSACPAPVAPSTGHAA